MHQNKAVRMGEISRSAQLNEEEQVGLLEDSFEDLDASRESIDEEDAFPEKPVKPRRTRRRWVKSCAVVLLVVCAAMLVAHWYRGSQERTTAPSTQARLRPEEDYILDSTWDFDAPPTTREYSWVIADHELNPDGVYRPMMLINSTFPGPLLEVNEDDEIIVHVHNRATNATSIHWHGLYQNGTTYMDGTVGVTSCAIAPGHSFTYRFNVTGQSGTYYYHSHVSMQASDGLVGPLVIHSRAEKQLQQLPYDQDRILMLSDHYYDPSPLLLWTYLAPGSENDEPVPASALINGRNARDCAALPARKCIQDRRRALFDLRAGTNTRLRVVNVGAFAEFSLQIDEHELRVTEVDGTDVSPQSVHRLNIHPGQRYSVVVQPPAEARRDGYWIRARMVTHCFAYDNEELMEEVWGVLRYGSVDVPGVEEPQSKDWDEVIEVECRDLNTTLLEPVHVVRAPDRPDDVVYLRSSFQIGDWRLSRGFLNESSWRTNATTPVLHTLLDARADIDADAAAGIDTVHFNPQTQLVHSTHGIHTLDILIQNLDDGTHPFHLHGYKFFVLAHGHGYAPLPSSPLYNALNLTNPLRRDTASVEAYGWLLIRFVADNPGAWAFHCHIGWHAEAGLGMVFATRVGEVRGVPGEVEGLCGVEGVERGMGPGDGEWVGVFE